MIRIAIVDDAASDHNDLRDYLNRFTRENGMHFAITDFSDGSEITEGYTAEYDIILMDIAMSYMNGMRAAEAIRKLDDEVIIIFITATPQYAMRGYIVNALDYVLKPVSYFAFSQRIQRAIDRLGKRKQRYISIPCRGGMRKISVNDITYVEVQDHDLTYHTEHEALPAKGTLAEAEDMLGSSLFFRCNKCYLVNLEHIDGIAENNVFLKGEQIQVSRSKKKALLNALNNYISEVNT